MLDANDHLFFLEQQQWSGRYPKSWDRPSMQRAIKRTGAVILPLAMCEFAKTFLSDAGTDLLVQKWSWVLVSKALMPWILSVWRPCSAIKSAANHPQPLAKLHIHQVLEGKELQTNVDRMQKAA